MCVCGGAGQTLIRHVGSSWKVVRRRAPETKTFPTMSAFLAQDDRKRAFFVALKSSEQKHFEFASLTAFFAGMARLPQEPFSSPLQVDP